MSLQLCDWGFCFLFGHKLGLLLAPQRLPTTPCQVALSVSPLATRQLTSSKLVMESKSLQCVLTRRNLVCIIVTLITFATFCWFQASQSAHTYPGHVFHNRLCNLLRVCCVPDTIPGMFCWLFHLILRLPCKMNTTRAVLQIWTLKPREIGFDLLKVPQPIHVKSGFQTQGWS